MVALCMWTSLKETGVCWYVWPFILASCRQANTRYPVAGYSTRPLALWPVRYASSESGDETSTSTVLEKPLLDPLEHRARKSSTLGTSQLSEWSHLTSDDNIGVVDDTGSRTDGYIANGSKLTPFKYNLEPHEFCYQMTFNSLKKRKISIFSELFVTRVRNFSTPNFIETGWFSTEM